MLSSAVLLFNSCVEDPELNLDKDIRERYIGDYFMQDSVYFLGTFNDTINYHMTISLDSLEGDTVLLENMFDFSIDLKAVMNYQNGTFIIPAQPHDGAMVSGNGTYSSGNITYSASYDDGGYSFIGQGSRD